MRITTRSRRPLDDMLHAPNAPWMAQNWRAFGPLIKQMPPIAAAPLGMFPHKTFAWVFFRQPLAPIFLGAGATRLWR